MEWINNNTGILILFGISVSFATSLLLRWQADEQGKDARKLIVQRDNHNQWIEFWTTGYRLRYLTDEKFLDALRKEDELMQIFVRGSKHQWFNNLCIQVRRKFREN